MLGRHGEESAAAADTTLAGGGGPPAEWRSILHECNNQLSVILSYAYALGETLGDDEQLRAIVSAAEQAAELVHTLQLPRD